MKKIFLLFFLCLAMSTNSTAMAFDFDAEKWAEKQKKVKALKYAQKEWGKLVKKQTAQLNAEHLIQVVVAMIAVESSGRPENNLMGVSAIAAREIGKTPQNILNPKKNIETGVEYLLNMLDKFDNDIFLALAAYNGGEGVIRKKIKKGEKIPGGIKEYPVKVLYLTKFTHPNFDHLLATIDDPNRRQLIEQL